MKTPPPRDVFSEGHPYGSRSADVERVRTLVDAELITVEFIRLPFSRHYNDHWERNESLFSGRTGSHRRLCHSVSLWLESMNIPWTTKPASLAYSSGIADVASSNAMFFAECGYTQARKVEACARGVSVMVVPYLDEGVYGEAPIGCLFKAKDTDRLSTELNRLDEPQMALMREALERHGRR